ncbi:MAG: transcriptional regulator PpsR [Yoonia sp.]|nr:transcriptional regulator PpsR [Yoonia sp.]
MMSPGDMAWTSGLIPMIEPDEVTKIISRISDIALVMSQDGMVIGVMTNPSFRGEFDLNTWQGRNLTEELTVESIPKLNKRLQEVQKGGGSSQALELNHKANGAYPEFPIRYSFHRIGSDGAILLLGSDLRSTAEMQQQLVGAQIALEQDYEAQRDRNLKFRVLMSVMDEPVIYLSPRSGLILEANTAAAAMMGKTQADLAGAAFTSIIEDKSSGELVDRLVASATEESSLPVKAVAIYHHKPIYLRPKLFRTSGEQVLLCKLSSPEGELSRPDLQSENLAYLFEAGVDAIVFVNAAGTILSGNEAFLKLADVAHAHSIKGRTLADFLSRGSIDLNVMLDSAKRTGAMRLYATKIKSELGVDRSIEISTTRLKAGNDPVYALIIRDASRIEAVRPASSQVTDVDMQSVIEYIGSQSLKDIVAKTTDVVEKMCIETAVEMTSNNRVAAAEMLGLSRQSLYVKLRKYGLVKKD